MLHRYSGTVSLLPAHKLLACLKKLISEHLFTSLARNFLYTFVVHFAFQRWYLKRYSWQASIIIGEVEFRNQDRWEINVSRLTVVWDLVRIGGALSVPYVPPLYRYITFHLTLRIVRLPIALLQLPVAFGNTTLRIIAISAFLLAASSLVSASVFIASKEHLLTSATKREKWIDASICPKLFLSIDFWSCLSWPITSFVWWVFLCYYADLEIFTYTSMHAGRSCYHFLRSSPLPLSVNLIQHLLQPKLVFHLP